MFVKRLAFVLLIVSALSSVVDTAMAQFEPQQFVVVYVEFKPANARAGGDVLQQTGRACRGQCRKTQGSTPGASKPFHLAAANRDEADEHATFMSYAKPSIPSTCWISTPIAGYGRCMLEAAQITAWTSFALRPAFSSACFAASAAISAISEG